MRASSSIFAFSTACHLCNRLRALEALQKAALHQPSASPVPSRSHRAPAPVSVLSHMRGQATVPWRTQALARCPIGLGACELPSPRDLPSGFGMPDPPASRRPPTRCSPLPQGSHKLVSAGARPIGEPLRRHHGLFITGLRPLQPRGPPTEATPSPPPGGRRRTGCGNAIVFAYRGRQGRHGDT